MTNLNVNEIENYDIYLEILLYFRINIITYYGKFFSLRAMHFVYNFKCIDTIVDPILHKSKIAVQDISYVNIIIILYSYLKFKLCTIKSI